MELNFWRVKILRLPILYRKIRKNNSQFFSLFIKLLLPLGKTIAYIADEKLKNYLI